MKFLGLIITSLLMLALVSSSFAAKTSPVAMVSLNSIEIPDMPVVSEKQLTRKVQIRMYSLLQDYELALQKGRGKIACSNITPKAAKLLQSKVEVALEQKFKNCEQTVQAYSKVYGKYVSQSSGHTSKLLCLKTPSSDDPQCKVIRIQAKSPDGSTVSVSLIKRAGKWKIYYYQINKVEDQAQEQTATDTSDSTQG